MKKIEDKISKEMLETFLREGIFYKEICEKFNICNSSLYLLFKKYNINRINKNQKTKKNDEFFDVIDSEIKAYLLGFLVADGSVIIEPKKRNGEIYSYNKRISILNSIDDIETINLFNQHICPNNTIEYVNNQSGAVKRKLQCKIRWTSPYMVDKLISYGINPRKTYEIDFKFNFDILVNDKLKIHFLRGFFDGDGCVSINNKTLNGKSYKNNVIGFVSTSKIFLTQIIDFYKNYGLDFKLTCRHGKNMDYYNINLSGGKTAVSKFKEIMYKDAQFFLSRKFNKFIE